MDHSFSPHSDSGVVSRRKDFRVQRERHNGTAWVNLSSSGAEKQVWAPVVGKQKPGRKPAAHKSTSSRKRSAYRDETPEAHATTPPTECAVIFRTLRPAGELLSIHILPANIFSIPIRLYPRGALPAITPVAQRLQASGNGDTALESIVTMSNLFDVLQSGGRRSIDIKDQHAELIRLARVLLNHPRRGLDLQVVVTQLISTLALVATLVGKYEEWHTHMNGLAGVITSTEQLRALPHLVQVHAQKASIKGAFERLEQPKLPFAWALGPIWSTLATKIRDDLSTRVRALFQWYDASDAVTDTFVEIAYMAHVAEEASQSANMKYLELPQLTESHFYLVYRLLTAPRLLTRPENLPSRLHASHQHPLHASEAAHDGPDCRFNSFDEALRLSALLFFKLVKGGSRERWDQHVTHLWLLNTHLRRILIRLQGHSQSFFSTMKDTSMPSTTDEHDTDHYSLLRARGPLIWMSLIGEAIAAASENERWTWPSDFAPDPDVYSELLAEVLGSVDDASDLVLPEKDLEFCHIFHLGIMQGFFWDVRGEVTRVLRGLPRASFCSF